MSRSLGAYVIFDQASFAPEVVPLMERAEDLSPAMRIVSYLAAEDGRLQSRGDGDRPRPEWPALPSSTKQRKRRRGSPVQIGVGVHGGFAGTIRPFYGKRNAGWKTRAPHAHLFEGGTEAYSDDEGKRVFRWGWTEDVAHEVTKGKTKGQMTRDRRRSRAQALGLDGTKWNGDTRQPDRPFAYFATGFHDRANGIIAHYFLTGEETSS